MKMKANRRIVLVILGVIIVLFGATVLMLAHRISKDGSGTVGSITVAYAPYQAEVLFYIAENQQFFSQNGLAVVTRQYEFPAASLDGVLNGEADIAVGVAEYPLVIKALQKKAVRIIGCICKSDFIHLIGRKDRGITKLSDLRGKRVGTTFGTITDFYLERLLQLNGLIMNEITPVYLQTDAERQNALPEGSVDAQVASQPNASALRDRLGDNATFLPAQSGQHTFALAISRNEWIAKHPDLVCRFLKSLAQAEEYVNRHPDETRKIVLNRINVSMSQMDETWSQARFSLSLDQSLITAMEDEARMMIMNKLTTERQVPNFEDYIYQDALKGIRPEAVNIIR
jgi:ABC-type nitrate/sulfonate/bicarbonate transport system substrate-binding protein